MKYQTRVVTGNGRGKFLGYPTLNLVIPQDFEYPHGIYAGHVSIKGEKYLGAFHFGPVPTYQQSQPTLEVFVLDTDLKETPTAVEFEFTDRLREIINFDTQEALVNQITLDVDKVRQLLSQ